MHSKGEALIIGTPTEVTRAVATPLPGPNVGEHVYALSIRWHDGRWQRLAECAAEQIVAIDNLRADYGSLLTAL